MQSQSVFDEQFALETIRSEQMRATFVAAAFGTIGIVFFFFQWFGQSEFMQILRAAELHRWILLTACGMVAYELLVFTMLGRISRRSKKVPLPVRYMNALLETSVPTVIIVIFARAIDPLYALISIAPLLYFVFIVLSALRLEVGLCIFTGCVAAAEYVSVALIYTSDYSDSTMYPMLRAQVFYVAKGLFYLITTLGAAFVARQIKRRIIASNRVTEERNAIVQLFGQHVAPAVVDELLRNNADTGTSRKYVCVMFADIRGFTQFAEKKSPEETVAYLNTMFEFMIEIVNKNHGIIHQLLGDGFMAIFGAPSSHGNDAGNAVNAATEILDAVQQEVAAGKIPPTRVGIGLHAGEVVAGTVGSSLHKEYKVTGDVVNVASRIEQLNKEFNSQILISGEVLQAIGKHEKAVSLGAVPVKGRERPIAIYSLAM